ncbi:MAG: hypothetical protein ACI90V_010836 [Bacillariaceae sp.]|jgi:hypothetical protein
MSSSSPVSISIGTPPRSESMAYPKHHGGLLLKIQWLFRQHTKAVLATIGFLGFVVVISSDSLHDSGLGPGGSSLRGRLSSSSIGSSFSGVLRGGYFSVEGSKTNIENQFRFAAVTDLDQLSFMKDESKMTYRSLLMPGTITRNKDTNKYTMVMETADTRTLKTKHNEAGRGAEFSELTIFDGRLLTFDDRTGEVFEIMNIKDGKDSFVAPRYIITEGEGDTDKGMKWEWSTTKDGLLYMGSMGKEYTNPDGSVANVCIVLSMYDAFTVFVLLDSSTILMSCRVVSCRVVSYLIYFFLFFLLNCVPGE